MEKFTKDLPAWGISLIVNLSVLASLHFVVMQQAQTTEMSTIISDLADLPDQEQLTFSDRSSGDQVGSQAGGGIGLASGSMQVTAPGRDVPLKEKLETILNPEIPSISEGPGLAMEGVSVAAIMQGQKGNSDDAPGGVTGAMDRIAFEIQQSLKDRRTLVIWLFDASGSLESRREAIADRFDNIYKQLGAQGKTDGLYSVVASYGEKPAIHTSEPIQDVAKLSNIVRNDIKKDESGKEYVFGTLKLVLEKYKNWERNRGHWNRLVFIVTDERGDDAEQYLEDVITLAKRTQTKVYTIGNAAIFGREKGYVRYTAPDGFVADIPVDQGPESAFPDGVQLPFIGSPADWKLNQMSASYGPYALTRLCAETNGLYLITEDSKGYAFDRSIMRRYAPDYRPVRIQEQEISKNIAKSALVNVARMTYLDSLPSPALEFRAYNDNILRTDLGEAQKPVAEVDVPLRRLYEGLKIGEQGRDKLTEERWRAAFDLAMGRILAMRVRYAGYNLMLANMKVSPKAFTTDKGNMWRLVPSDKIESGPEMRKAAEQAKVYLRRVVDEHPGTPWAMLAERELSTEMGWSWEEFSQPIPGSDQLRGSDEEVARLLLADEENRREEAKKRPVAPKRELPKL
ncbi:vWA domain-containing protein [Planctomicrobium sp. SH661]|uniref:vWA domain-containing protein n=1 Tax=Planctomicrobium sp. SH661 TaxID=3448124 RepID=UPI003F5B2DC8